MVSNPMEFFMKNISKFKEIMRGLVVEGMDTKEENHILRKTKVKDLRVFNKNKRRKKRSY